MACAVGAAPRVPRYLRSGCGGALSRVCLPHARRERRVGARKHACVGGVASATTAYRFSGRCLRPPHPEVRPRGIRRPHVLFSMRALRQRSGKCFFTRMLRRRRAGRVGRPPRRSGLPWRRPRLRRAAPVRGAAPACPHSVGRAPTVRTGTARGPSETTRRGRVPPTRGRHAHRRIRLGIARGERAPRAPEHCRPSAAGARAPPSALLASGFDAPGR